MSKRIVVCAANRYEETVFIGVRHFCPLMRQNMEGHDIPWLRKTFGETQGFIDQYGEFMDRFEALKVAIEAGQINVHRLKTPPEDRLFSEDLY